ncbi:MAG: Rrf2 family transcriptional regulator [Patescibacteria group bacterium]
MKFSTRSEYGLRAIVQLDKSAKKAVSLASIATQEEISLAYLERLFALLKKAGLVKADKGVKGGYYLAKPAKQINVLQIIEALEGTVAPFVCVGGRDFECAGNCHIHPVWRKLYSRITSTLSSIKLNTLM